MTQASWLPYDQKTLSALSKLERRKHQVLITFWRKAIAEYYRNWSSWELNAAHLRLCNLYEKVGRDTTRIRQQYMVRHAQILAKKRLDDFTHSSRRSHIAGLRWLDIRLKQEGINPAAVGGALRQLRKHLAENMQKK